jgi:hypothetical protein
LYMKAIHGGKTKNDKIDSYKIAMLLKGGNFPTAYPYPAKWRATRDLLRRRMYISRRCSERNDSHPHRKGSILHSWDRNDNSFAPLRKNFRDIVPGINVS